eukprot:7663834-Pyramimonas_sp.AAC.1
MCIRDSCGPCRSRCSNVRNRSRVILRLLRLLGHCSSGQRRVANPAGDAHQGSHQSRVGLD